MATDVRDRLESLRDELTEEIARDQAELAVDVDDRGEDTTPSQHPADVASDLFARESLLTVERHLRGDLGAVEEALRRIDQGTYGICEGCGHRIPKERLDVLPHAVRCIECQRLEERIASRW